MNNYLLFSKIVKRICKSHSNIKMYSFRRFTFLFFINLYTKVINMFLNKLYVVLNCIRVRFVTFMHELFNLFTSVSIFGCSTSFNAYIIFDYYFNDCISSYLVYSNPILHGFSVNCGFMVLLSFVFLNYLQLFISFFHSGNLVMFPKTNKLFTVLRSPHTDKKSREQFHLVTFRGGFKDVSYCTKIILQSIQSLFFSSLFVRIRELEFKGM